MRYCNLIAPVLAGCAGLVFAGAAQAQTAGYPDHPVKIIVPFAAGGPTDVMGRLLRKKRAEKFGQQFYVENMVGAGGNLGMGAAARSPGDGYTILFASSSYQVNVSLYAKPPYGEKDLAPVTMAGASPNGVFVHPSVSRQDAARADRSAQSQSWQVHLRGARWRDRAAPDQVT